MSNLQELRQRITELDKQLLQTLKERFNVAQEIGDIKKEHIYDADRERELLESWLVAGLDENFTRALFHMILNESRSLMMKSE